MTKYGLVAQPAVERDVATSFAWYESQRAGLGGQFLDELRSTYARIQAGPLPYQELRAGIRRAMVRRFPFAGYLAVETDLVVVLAVLHAS